MPTCIIARTFKGKNFPDIENLLNWHGKALGDKTDAIVQHLQGLIQQPDAPNVAIQSPVEDTPAVDIGGVTLSSPPAYTKGNCLYSILFLLFMLFRVSEEEQYIN